MVGNLCVVPRHKSRGWKTLEKGYWKPLPLFCIHSETITSSLVGRHCFFRSNVCIIASSLFHVLPSSSGTSPPMWVTTNALVLRFFHPLHYVAVSSSFPSAHIPQCHLGPPHVRDLVTVLFPPRSLTCSFSHSLLFPRDLQFPILLLHPVYQLPLVLFPYL